MPTEVFFQHGYSMASSTKILGCLLDEPEIFVAVQDAVQELTDAMQTPPKGKREKNRQIRDALKTATRELFVCAELMEPSIVALAATRPTVQTLQQLSAKGYDTSNRGFTKVDYGNWQYTTVFKAVKMISPAIHGAMWQMSANHRAISLWMHHDDTEDALVNQGNVVETCLAQLFPEENDPMYSPQHLRAMKDKIIEVSSAIDVIYQVCRQSPRTKKNVIVEKHTVDFNNTAICTNSTEGFAAVVVALARNACT